MSVETTRHLVQALLPRCEALVVRMKADGVDLRETIRLVLAREPVAAPLQVYVVGVNVLRSLATVPGNTPEDVEAALAEAFALCLSLA